MSGRKRKNTFPERLEGERIRQLCWNLETKDRFQGNNDCVRVPGTGCTTHEAEREDIDKITLCQGSGAEIVNVSTSDDDVDNTFYKLMICDEVFANDTAGLLGCLSATADCHQLFLAPGMLTIEDSNIMVKVQRPGSNGSIISRATLSEPINFSSKRYLYVHATSEQIDGLAFLCKKGIIELVTHFNVHTNSLGCQVYVTAAGFTTIPIPSEDPPMGKAFKSMKILMQWLHGPLLPKVQAKTQPRKHYDDQVEYVFSTLKSKQSSSAKTTTTTDDALPSKGNKMDDMNLSKLQHPSLVPLLRGYQKRAVHWMIEQESVDTKAFAMGN